MRLLLLCLIATYAAALRGLQMPKRCRAIVMESEMDYRRRKSGDPRYIAKAAEDKLDVVCNEQAQAWLQLGGRTVKPPARAASAMSAAIVTAKTAGARTGSEAMKRATALVAALEAGPSTSAATNGLRPFSPARSGMGSSTLGREYSDFDLPSDFDGTRQGVARALRADRYRRQMTGADPPPGSSETRPAPVVVSEVAATALATIASREALEEGINLVETLPPAEAASMLNRRIGEALSAGLSPSSPVVTRAMTRASMLTQEEGAQTVPQHAAAASGDAVEEVGDEGVGTSLDAKLDAIWSFGYAEPSSGDADAQ